MSPSTCTYMENRHSSCLFSFIYALVTTTRNSLNFWPSFFASQSNVCVLQLMAHLKRPHLCTVHGRIERKYTSVVFDHSLVWNADWLLWLSYVSIDFISFNLSLSILICSLVYLYNLHSCTTVVKCDLFLLLLLAFHIVGCWQAATFQAIHDVTRFPRNQDQASWDLWQGECTSNTNCFYVWSKLH